MPGRYGVTGGGGSSRLQVHQSRRQHRPLRRDVPRRKGSCPARQPSRSRRWRGCVSTRSWSSTGSTSRSAAQERARCPCMRYRLDASLARRGTCRCAATPRPRVRAPSRLPAPRRVHDNDRGRRPPRSAVHLRPAARLRAALHPRAGRVDSAAETASYRNRKGVR